MTKLKDLEEISQFDLIDAFKFRKRIKYFEVSFLIKELKRTKHRNEFWLRVHNRKIGDETWIVLIRHEWTNVPNAVRKV